MRGETVQTCGPTKYHLKFFFKMAIGVDQVTAIHFVVCAAQFAQMNVAQLFT